jgi:hypothetical protein
MKINYFGKESLPIRTLAQHSLSGAGERIKELFAETLDRDKKISYWQVIFLQSKANGCFYRSEDFPHVKWRWPKDTWFQERLSQRGRDLDFGAQRLNN